MPLFTRLLIVLQLGGELEAISIKHTVATKPSASLSILSQSTFHTSYDLSKNDYDVHLSNHMMDPLARHELSHST